MSRLKSTGWCEEKRETKRVRFAHPATTTIATTIASPRPRIRDAGFVTMKNDYVSLMKRCEGQLENTAWLRNSTLEFLNLGVDGIGLADWVSRFLQSLKINMGTIPLTFSVSLRGQGKRWFHNRAVRQRGIVSGSVSRQSVSSRHLFEVPESNGK